jgi:hypothetical protein
MESTRDLSSILVRFSMVCHILRYYGLYSEWKAIMESLNTQTRNTWKTYLSEFRYISEKGGKYILQFEGLSDKFLKFMMNSHMYLDFELKIKLTTNEDYLNFIKLLNSAKEKKHKIQINFLTFAKLVENTWSYNQILDLINYTEMLDKIESSVEDMNNDSIYEKWIITGESEETKIVGEHIDSDVDII